jgi:hypothetical protein
MVLVQPNSKPKTNIMAVNWLMSVQIIEQLPITGLNGTLYKNKNVCFPEVQMDSMTSDYCHMQPLPDTGKP